MKLIIMELAAKKKKRKKRSSYRAHCKLREHQLLDPVFPNPCPGHVLVQKHHVVVSLQTQNIQRITKLAKKVTVTARLKTQTGTRGKKGKTPT